MEILLLERIENIGHMGDRVKVRPGYARNYLLPQQKALRATQENIAYFQRKRTQLETVNIKRREEATAVAARMDGLSLLIVRQAGESGQLYGSVTARDIAEAVTETGFTLQRHQVQLRQAIKTLGETVVWVSLHPEISVPVTITVVRSLEERGRIRKDKLLRSGSGDVGKEGLVNKEDKEDHD